MAPIFSTLQFAAYAYLLQYAANVSAAAIDARLAIDPYAPEIALCPKTPLVRAATSVGSSEAAYVTKRKANADTALAAWLKKTNSNFATTSLPAVGLTTSGGGYRSLLCGAGVVQALDSRDSNASTSGLYQSLTYHAGLSGGAWFLSSLSGNNWPTISSLKTNLWETAFADSLLIPENILVADAYSEIVEDILAKSAAGFAPTLTDVWGRLLSYQLLEGSDGGVSTKLSGLTSLSNFTSYNVPYPIITSRGVDATDGQCIPTITATQYEFGPYEFGSWDSGVAAFTQTKYLGSNLSNGKPVLLDVCEVDYDNLGYILGTSSTLFNEVCSVIPAVNSTTNLETTLEAIVARAHTPVLRDLYAAYKNPFYKYSASSLVMNQTELDLVDGGEAGQNNPLWPLLHYRNVSVVLVNDNSADTDDNWPNGTEILTTYQQAVAANLTRMPYIPPVATFVSEGLNKRATFFGCNDTNALTIVYLPNNDYTFASNVSTDQLEYPKTETDAMIANGNLIATQDGGSEWATCLGCAIMKKTGTTLPSACTACFTKYCYTQ